MNFRVFIIHRILQTFELFTNLNDSQDYQNLPYFKYLILKFQIFSGLTGLTRFTERTNS